MRKTRWLAAFFLPFLLVSFLQSQSLADLAKKEKERRAALKGKSGKVVTTAEVAKVKKRPAVESVPPDETAQGTGEAAVAAEGQAQGQAQGQEANPPAGAVTSVAEMEAAAGIAKPPAAATPGALTEQEFVARRAELMTAIETKQEMVDLLTLKLNALYQEMNQLDNMKSREFIQGQISETYDKLLKAELDAKKAAKDLDDFVATAKRENAQAIWIK